MCNRHKGFQLFRDLFFWYVATVHKHSIKQPTITIAGQHNTGNYLFYISILKYNKIRINIV